MRAALVALSLAISGCSMAFNTSKGACYHGTVFDVRNGSWDHVCAGEKSSMGANQEPMSPEFAEFLTVTIDNAIKAAIAGATGGGTTAAGAVIDALAGTRNTPDGRVPIEPEP